MITQSEQNRRNIDSIKEALKNFLPYEDKNYRINVRDIAVEGGDFTNLEQHKDIKMKGGTMGMPVYADLELIEKKKKRDKVIDRKRVKLFELPALSSTLSYLVDGVDYQVHSQLRRKPGIYTTIKADGTISSELNTKVGQNMKVILLPEEKKFNVQVGTSHIPVYTLLKSVGASDNAIQKRFPKIYNNIKLDEKGLLKNQKKLYSMLNFGKKTDDQEEIDRYFGEYFDRDFFDPRINEITVGNASSRISPETIMATMQKEIDVNKDSSKEDNPDNLAFKALYGLEDYIKERFKPVGASKNLYDTKVKNRLRQHRKIKEVIKKDYLTDQLKGLISNYDLVEMPSQLNPINMLSGADTVTIMGSGGIRNDRAVTLNNRNLDYSHIGFLDPIHTPEGYKIGTTLHGTLGTRKRDDNEIVQDFLNVKTSKIQELSPYELYNNYVAMPDQYEKGKPISSKVDAIYKGQKLRVSSDKVNYVLPDITKTFDWNSNLVPFLQSNYGARALMANKMLEQALPLKEPDEPLIQTQYKDTSFEKLIGHKFSLNSPVDGIVDKVSENKITIKDKGGKYRNVKLIKNIILNSDSTVDLTPAVKEGDKVKKGDVIGETQFTSNGTLALGKNLNVAYLPWHGYNFEDGIIVSEDAANKLTSRHVYTKEIEIEPDSISDKKKFIARFPSAFTTEQLRKIGDDGMIREKMLEKDEPIYLYMKKVKPTYEDKLFGLISKTFMREYKDRSIVWDKDVPGTVVGVSRKGNKLRVYLTTEEPLRVGDKISGRHGNKGVVTKILANNEMPKTEDGEVLDVLFNPLGIPSRMNIGQVYETIASKVADKIGKPIIIKNFDRKNTYDQINNLMNKFGIADTETLINPNTGKPYPRPVLTGKQFIMKLNHQAEHKMDARYRAGYDANLQPITGGEEGGKKLDQLTLYAMLAHGARENIREAATIKSEKNDEFWRAVEMGLPLPPPKPTFAFNKFLSYLTALGVDTVKNGNHMFLSPLTDKQVLAMSGGEIKNPQAIRGKDFKPIADGLFDVYKTGGLGGKKFSHIVLHENMPNPVFENTIKVITGLTPAQYDGLLGGELFMKRSGEFTDKASATTVTGGKAFDRLLKSVDLSKEIKKLRSDAKGKRGDQLNKINRKLRYYLALKRAKLQPQEAYMLKNVPVVPPVFRPLYTLDGRMKMSDLNVGYHDIIMLNNSLKQGDGIPEKQKSEARKRLYDATKALMGLGAPVGHRPFRGILDIISGTTQPKSGFFQSVLVKKKQEPSARAAITVEPKYGIDEVGLPEDIAWTIYQPFVMRRMVKMGKPSVEALHDIENRTEFARKALELEVKERPVIINRAPSLHKFSVLAFHPRLIPEKSLKLNPLVTKGFNADFDGDAMSIYVPTTDKAVSEAKNILMASKNIFKPGENRIILAPSQESLLGLYELSKKKEGKKQLKDILGDYWDTKSLLDAKNIDKILTGIANKNKDDFIDITQKLKDLGYKTATDEALSFSMKDFKPIKHLKKIDDPIEVETKLKKETGILIDSALSGARGHFGHIRQVRVGPNKIYDIMGKEYTGLEKGYSEGLPLNQYIDSLFGARKGMIDKGTSIREPGALAKNIINSTMDKIITQDVSTGEGIAMRTTDPSIHNRYLSKSLKDEKGRNVYPKDTLVTPDILNDIKRRKIKEIFVRSPLTDTTAKGLASKDFGILPWGSRPDIGENLGIIASHTITEPLSQATLKRFHIGGASMEQGGLPKIKSVLEMPRQLKNKAILSKIEGTVESVKKSPLGGNVIKVQDEEHYLPGRLNPMVAKGDKVNVGDRLSTGQVSPHDIFDLKGILPARKFIADEIYRAVDKEGFDKRYAEVIARSITDKAVVLDPGESGYQSGDTVSLNQVESEAKEKNITYQPILTGVNFYPIKSEDWLARLNSRELKKTLTEGVSQGWSTNIHGTHPIPALVYGQEFGRGQDGRY